MYMYNIFTLHINQMNSIWLYNFLSENTIKPSNMTTWVAFFFPDFHQPTESQQNPLEPRFHDPHIAPSHDGSMGMIYWYHLESRWRNSHILVYHSPLRIATFWELRHLLSRWEKTAWMLDVYTSENSQFAPEHRVSQKESSISATNIQVRTFSLREGMVK